MNTNPGIVISAALMVTVAACGSDGDDEPKRPPIARALDASAYADRPCDLLSRDQAAQLGYPKPGDETKDASNVGTNGPTAACDWGPPGSASMYFRLYLAYDYLANRYRFGKNSTISDTNEPVVEPLTIAGQPAVTVARSHKRPNRQCVVVVGLTDTQSLEVLAMERYQNPEGYNDGLGDGRACDYAIPVAEAIVHRLGG